MIASDLDGTLLRSDGTVSTFTRASLSRARSAGIIIVLVSARGPAGVADVAEAAGVDGMAICSNGAIVVDLEQREVVRHRTLPSEIASDAIRSLRERLPEVCFATETESQFALEPAFKGAWGGWEPEPGTAYGDALELVTAPVTKPIARDVSRPNAELAAVASEVVGDRAAVSMAGESVVEINAAGVNKGAALDELAADLGIRAQEAVAFGDYPNDMTMLAWAGWSIAPANAHPEVLARVDQVTESNDADGVALAIDRIMENRSGVRLRPGPGVWFGEDL